MAFIRMLIGMFRRAWPYELVDSTTLTFGMRAAGYQAQPLRAYPDPTLPAWARPKQKKRRRA